MFLRTWKNCKAFFAGFVKLGEICLKKGIDLKIFPTYVIKKKKAFVFDKPIPFSKLQQQFSTREEIAQDLCNKVNALRHTDVDVYE